MRIFIIVFTAVLLQSAAANGINADIYGYFEPTASGFLQNDEFSQMFQNKLRVDLFYSPSEKAEFGANFDFITYHGETAVNYLDYIPQSLSQTVPEDERYFYDFQYEDEKFLDNAFLKLKAGKIDITAGKQQLSFGSGYAWNPTDIINTKLITDPTYEQRGVNALRFDYYIGQTVLNAVYLPGSDFDESGKLFKISTPLGHFDLSGQYAEKEWNIFGFQKDKRSQYGVNINGELLGLGVWTESALNNYNDEDYLEILTGFDYTFDNELYVMGEYLYTELGKSDCSEYTINHWMNFISGEIRTVSQDNLYLYLKYPVTDLLDFSQSGIISISDGSFALVPEIQYYIYANVDIKMMLNLYLGKEDTAYDSDLGQSAVIRCRIYF